MASRTKQKEQARAARLAAEQAQAEHDRRVRRLRMLIGACVAAVIVVVVAVVVSSGGSTLKTGGAAEKTVGHVNQLLTGIPQSGTRLGNPEAPVTMTYYGDLQCPICAEFTKSDGFTNLVANEVRAGKLQVVYRNFQTATHDPAVFVTQQGAALSAGRQNRFWDYTELFYRQQGTENSGYVTDAFLTGLARQIPGLNMARWNSDRSDQGLANQVTADVDAGRAAQVQGTPALIFHGPKGSVMMPHGIPSYAALQHGMQSVS
jgi:protein-disulfide isomerase